MRHLSKSYGNIFLPLVPALLFLAFAVPQLTTPGIQYDEAHYIPPAVRILEGELRGEPIQIDPSVIHLFGRPFPLMFNYYTSFLRMYLALPIFALFGVNAVTIRGFSLMLALGAIIFTFHFFRRFSGDNRIAFISALLLSFDASFVVYSRQDYAVVGTMMLFKMASLWSLVKWRQVGGKAERERGRGREGEGNRAGGRWLYLGLFLMGLGISDRASFLWIVIALIPALILARPSETLDRLRVLMRAPRVLIAATVAFAAGASIFLAFNLATLGGTFSPMVGNFDHTEAGANNLAFWQNFVLRLKMLTDVLAATYLPRLFESNGFYMTSDWSCSPSPLAWLFPLSFFWMAGRQIVRSLTWTKGTSKSKGSHKSKSDFTFMLVLTTVIFIQTCFTPTRFSGHQLLMLYPFLHGIVAMCLVDVFNLLRMDSLQKDSPTEWALFSSQQSSSHSPFQS